MEMEHKYKLYFDQQGKCKACGRFLEENSMDVDHVVRKKDGGGDDIENKQLLCVACHRQKTADENRGKRIDCSNLFHTQLKKMMTITPAQNHRPRNVGQLYSLHVQGQLLLADLNRKPVWSAMKKSDYILALIEGKVTPPLFFNKLGCVCYIYDCGNRFHAIKEFLEGGLLVRLREGNLKGAYRIDSDHDDSTYEFDERERNLFDNITLDVFEWDNLEEEVACELALRLNQGIVMNVSERLKLDLAQDTSRAKFVRKVYEAEEVKSLRDKVDRECLLKSIVIAVRALTDETRSLRNETESRPKYESLANFLKGTEDVVDSEELMSKLCSAAKRALQQDSPTGNAFLEALIELVPRAAATKRSSFQRLSPDVCAGGARRVASFGKP